MQNITHLPRGLRRIVGAGAAVALAASVGLGVAPAQASDVWDDLAQCESSGDWSINTGNGYYGGLQFSPQTWDGFGGEEFADDAHQASKAEQIAVARRVLDVQGPGAWPVCSVRAGLTKSNGGADSDAQPGGESAPSKPSEPAKPSTPEGSGKTVTVESGDTLSSLAREHGVDGGWSALAKANPQISNPNVIAIGDKITLP